MLTRDDLQIWVLEALKKLGGKARIKEVAKEIWNEHRPELEANTICDGRPQLYARRRS
jgi:hypothetical protein